MSIQEKTPKTREEFAHSISSSRAAQQAMERSCTVVPADDYTLQLDIDSEEDLAFMDKQLDRLQHIITFEKTETRSSGGNWHVTLKMKKPMDVIERLMLQAMLGSDPVREILSYARHKFGEPQPILFFEPIRKVLPEPSDEEAPF